MLVMTYPQSSSSIDLIYDVLSYLLNSLPLTEGEQLSSAGIPYQVLLPLDPLSFHDTHSILLFQAVVLHPFLIFQCCSFLFTKPLLLFSCLCSLLGSIPRVG